MDAVAGANSGSAAGTRPGGLAGRRVLGLGAGMASLSPFSAAVRDQGPAASPPAAASRPVTGALWMFVSGLAFVLVTGIVRYLGTELPAAQGAFIRYAWGVVLLAPALWRIARGGLARDLARTVVLRGAVHTVAVILWFFAMARIPVAEVTAIGYLNPICVTLGAALFLGERLALRRIVAVAVALAGALVILRPGLRAIEPGHYAQLCAAVGFAVSYLTAKTLTGRLPATAIVALLSASVAAGLAPFALAAWVPVAPHQVLWLGVVAVAATFGHYAMTRAFAAAPISVTQPVTFLQLLWATLLGALVFHERVDPLVLLGGGIIIASVFYITWREASARRGGVTPGGQAGKI